MNKGIKIFAGILIALGISGGLIYAFTRKTADKIPPPEPAPEPSPAPPTDQKPTTTAPSSNSGIFPLIVGMSNNVDVKKMQKSLMANFSIIIPAGATGNFGAQTVFALKQAGYSAVVSKRDYDDILNGLRKGQQAQDPNAFKKDDRVVTTSDAVIYEAPNIGKLGTIFKGGKAYYIAPFGGGAWSKINALEYVNKDGRPVFQQTVAYIKTSQIKKYR